jgi:hypothetical protein
LANNNTNNQPFQNYAKYFSCSPCGERGIRTPGTVLQYTRFPGVPVKPLLHLSRFSGMPEKQGRKIIKIWEKKVANYLFPLAGFYSDSF